jgi:hypothetical protein
VCGKARTAREQPERPIHRRQFSARIVTRQQESSIIDTNRQSIVDFDGESSNSTESHRFVIDDHHFVTARRRFRRLIIDFDDESMIRDDSLTQGVSESSTSTVNRQIRRTIVALHRLFIALGQSVITLRRLIIDFDG